MNDDVITPEELDNWKPLKQKVNDVTDGVYILNTGKGFAKSPTPIDTWAYMLKSKSNHKQKEGNKKMKHKIVLIISLLVIIGAIAGCLVKYEQHRQYRDAQYLKAKASALIKQEQVKAQALRAQAQLASLKAQCSSDHQRYLAETPAQRQLKTSVSDCNPALTLVQ